MGSCARHLLHRGVPDLIELSSASPPSPLPQRLGSLTSVSPGVRLFPPLASALLCHGQARLGGGELSGAAAAVRGCAFVLRACLENEWCRGGIAVARSGRDSSQPFGGTPPRREATSRAEEE
ncbi:unnamed protein product [Pleuronectes platessa]|uniref:Uncharacterized protein n=1 Tax=Pleuronectes platessa TaxID=8262 RepID=A0A9N7Z2P5_PLEPL|nr:unnamed protein product [Pleuronectes platessa]